MPTDDTVAPPSKTWSMASGGVRLSFLGRGGPCRPQELAAALESPPQTLGWLSQVHSDRVLEACSGEVGEGDALVTSERGLGLAVATADCVPVLLASGPTVAAVHAGWRGLVAGVLPRALAHLEPTAAEAWIGPAIGACCYEVDEDVAARLEAATGPEVVVSTTGRKPHVDLQAAAIWQLRAHGLQRIHRLHVCTKCHPDVLWSYRGQGERAGRNWAVIWRP